MATELIKRCLGNFTGIIENHSQYNAGYRFYEWIESSKIGNRQEYKY